MKQVKSAAFAFESFKIPQFSYNEENDNGIDLSINFDPKGIYDSESGEFVLHIKCSTFNFDNKDSLIFSVSSVSKFKFNDVIALEEIPDYFYVNSIAIVFPYIRAFISTLTLQANTKMLRLGLMNLTKLEKTLRENTELKST